LGIMEPLLRKPNPGVNTGKAVCHLVSLDNRRFPVKANPRVSPEKRPFQTNNFIRSDNLEHVWHGVVDPMS